MKTNVGSFYLQGKQDEWKEYRAICKREGTTASKKILAHIMQYVENHGPGNPQLTKK